MPEGRSGYIVTGKEGEMQRALFGDDVENSAA